VTVKVRTGERMDKPNVDRVVPLLAAAGAALVTVHGRSMEQRYKRAADWGMISGVARSADVPLIGNGDILTYYEAAARLDPAAGCHAAMIGRGALIKPWIWQEVKEARRPPSLLVDLGGGSRLLRTGRRRHCADSRRLRSCPPPSLLPTTTVAAAAATALTSPCCRRAASCA